MSGEQFDHTITDAVKISEQAEAQLLELVSSEDDINGVRIFIAGGGCSGMTADRWTSLPKCCKTAQPVSKPRCYPYGYPATVSRRL